MHTNSLAAFPFFLSPSNHRRFQSIKSLHSLSGPVVAVLFGIVLLVMILSALLATMGPSFTIVAVEDALQADFAPIAYLV